MTVVFGRPNVVSVHTLSEDGVRAESETVD